MGFRRDQESDQRPRGLDRSRANVLPGCEGGDVLYVARQMAQDVDAGNRHQLAHLLEAELDFVFCDQGADKDAGFGLDEFRPDRVLDTQAPEQAAQVDTARSARKADRLGRKQCMLERVAGGNVGTWRAGSYRGGNAGLGGVDAAAATSLPLCMSVSMPSDDMITRSYVSPSPIRRMMPLVGSNVVVTL